MSYQEQTNISYSNQAPMLEMHGVTDSREQVITYHASGKRFILKPDGTFRGYQAGMEIKTTSSDIYALRTAIEKTGDSELLAIFYRYNSLL